MLSRKQVALCVTILAFSATTSSVCECRSLTNGDKNAGFRRTEVKNALKPSCSITQMKAEGISRLVEDVVQMNGGSRLVQNASKNRKLLRNLNAMSMIHSMNFFSIDNYIDGVFDKADINRDGSISIDEVYELVLLIYIKLNRQAPISPPSRAKIIELFTKFDTKKDGRLNSDEFKQFALIGVSRASAKVLSHKLLTFMVAPMLAWKLVKVFPRKEQLGQISKVWLPEKYLNTVLSESFWNMGLTILFVSTLGDFAIHISDYLFDSIAFNRKNMN